MYDLEKKESNPKSNSKTKTSKTERHLITAALPYANGPIHIGHLLEYIQADIYSRFLKLQGKDALYICASDMHGTPIEINAQKAGKKPELFAQEFWKEHQQDFTSFLIQFDNYSHTDSPENKEMVNYFYQELKKKNLIYTKSIKVVYCQHCKRSLPDRFVKGTCSQCHAEDQYGDVCEKCSTVLKGIDLLNPYCTICKNKPVHKDSTHYFFKLSAFSKQLSEWINSTETPLQQEVKNWLSEWLQKGLEDWCISRDAPYFGFEIPESRAETGETKFFYVWMDAPIGYISSTQNYCDKQSAKKLKWQDYWNDGKVEHFIGKDIAYFHFLFWPAMLLAIGIPLPQLTVHGFVNVNGEKMSKSRGTFFTAKEFLQIAPAEALRFYYASHLDRKVSDVDLNLNDFQAFNNNVLMGNLGNFCYRVLTFAEKNYPAIKDIAKESELSLEMQESFQRAAQYYSEKDFRSAVKELLKISDKGNSYFQNHEPWKSKDDPKTIAAVGWCVNLARNLSILVAPILPLFAEKVQSSLQENSSSKKTLSWTDLGFQWKGKVGKIDLLVQKIEISQEEFPLRLMVGEIVDVKNHPNADSLYLFQVNLGDFGKKQVVAGLKKYFLPEELRGKKAVFCVNLKPSKLRGEMSEAMTVAAEDQFHHISLLEVSNTTPGTEVRFGTLKNSAKEISYDEFQKVTLTVQKGGVFFENKPLAAPTEAVTVKNVEDGAKIC